MQSLTNLIVNELTILLKSGNKIECIALHEIKHKQVNPISIHEEKALIVDDEIDICYLLSGILKQKKFRTSYVNSLGDAQAVLNKEKPGIIFLDNNLPDGKGVEFISKVKELYPATKVVMITAFDTYSDRSKAYEEGADFFIGKPFTRDMIDKTIERLMYSGFVESQAS